MWHISVDDLYPATTSLNDYLRDVAGLKGTKVMCREAGCGCCAVSVTHACSGDKVETMTINSVRNALSMSSCVKSALSWTSCVRSTLLWTSCANGESFHRFSFFFVVAAKQLQIWPHALTGVVYLLLFSQSVMSFVHWYFLFFQFFISKLISAVIIITTATNITISHHHNVLDGVNASWFCSWFLLFEVVLFPIYSKYKLMLFIII